MTTQGDLEANMIKDDNTVEQRLSDGAFFGEVCLICPNLTRMSWVYADSQVNLYALEKSDFQQIIKRHPSQLQQIEMIAKDRMDTLIQKKKQAEEDTQSHLRKRNTMVNPEQMQHSVMYRALGSDF